MDQLPPGTATPCYYDPRNVRRVVLKRDGYHFTAGKVLFDLIPAYIGVGLVLYGRRRLRRHSQG